MMDKIFRDMNKEVKLYLAIGIIMCIFSMFNVFDFVLNNLSILFIIYFAIYIGQVLVIKKINIGLIVFSIIIPALVAYTNELMSGSLFYHIRVDIWIEAYFAIIALYYAIKEGLYKKTGSFRVDIFFVIGFCLLIGGFNYYLQSDMIVRDRYLNNSINHYLNKRYPELKTLEQKQKNMTRLMTRYSHRIKSLEGIEQFVNLKSLNINDGKYISDYSPLLKLSNLERLYIDNGDLDSLNNSGMFESLRYLEVGYWYRGEGLDGRNFPALESLSIGGHDIEDLTSFKNMDSIKYLDLYYCNIKSMNGLESMKNLEEIHFYNVNLDSIDGFVKLPNVKKIDYGESDIKDIEKLRVLYGDSIVIKNY